MNIFDILTNGPLGGVIDVIKNQGGFGNTGGFGNSGDFGSGRSSSAGGGFGSLGSTIGSVLESIGGQAREVATDLRDKTPGGMGGLIGAGTLGAVLGNLMSGSAVKGVALAGAAAVAWNFYKKWAQDQQANQTAQPQSMPEYSQVSASAPQALPQHADAVTELVLRSMIYAARADGNIEPEERKRINAVLANMLPGQNLDAVIETISQEPLNPSAIARMVKSPEQAEDVYRLSCATLDIDHFMERGYLDELAKALNISASQQKVIEAEANSAKRQLESAVQGA